MGTAVTTAEVVQEVVHIIIETIGRKTSDGYAVIAVRGAQKNILPSHPCLRYLEIHNARYIEFGESITVDPKINELKLLEVGRGLQDLLTRITSAMRKSAGYFLIKEIRDSLPADRQKLLLEMGVDLNLLQFSQEMRIKEPDLLAILPRDVVRRMLKAALTLLEHQINREFAYHAVSAQVLLAREQYPFLEYVTINDIKITLGAEEVAVDERIDTIDPLKIGAALNQVLAGIDTLAQEHSGNPILETLKAQLTLDYMTKLEEFGVTLIVPASDMTVVLRDVIRTLVFLLTQVSSQEYAIHTLNTFLHDSDDRSAILHFISVKNVLGDDGVPNFSVMIDIQHVSENDTRRAIQGLLETMVRSLGESLRGSFIEKFQTSLDKPTLARIEKIGVNLHMIALHVQLREQWMTGGKG